MTGLTQAQREGGVKLIMPSPADLRVSSLRWFERIGPTLIDQWPADLAALSMPTELVPFPMEAIEPMYDANGEEPAAVVQNLAAMLDAKIGWKRRFVRLNSRSPKDSIWPYESPAILSGKEAISMMASSERCLDDLCFFRYIPEHPAYICLRDWVYGFRTQNEYRCFVKDGRLIAVSHYDYINPWGGPEDNGKSLRASIDAWFADTLRPRLHIDTVVFDLYIEPTGTFLLIEINPYGLSDPCHFGSYERMESAKTFIAFAPDAGRRALAEDKP